MMVVPCEIDDLTAWDDDEPTVLHEHLDRISSTSQQLIEVLEADGTSETITH